MQFQEVDMQGKFHVERVATTPTWTSADEGRFIYVEDIARCAFGSGSQWKIFAFDITTETEYYPNLDGYNRKQPVATQVFQESDFSPWTNNSYDLGDPSYKWRYVYAYTLSGEATEATYADLAEKYTAPQDYPTGTIVEVSDSQTYEMGAARPFSEKVSGVISATPGYLMNAQNEGVTVGLVGRVPIRIIGPVKKRDWIISAGDGLGKTGEKLYKIAVALESNDNPDEKLVECLLKV